MWTDREPLVVALPILHTSQEVALKNRVLTVGIVALLLATTTSLALAGGYQVNEHNARAMGMGGAFVAIASDASAVFFNPAGMSKINGKLLTVGKPPFCLRIRFSIVPVTRCQKS